MKYQRIIMLSCLLLIVEGGLQGPWIIAAEPSTMFRDELHASTSVILADRVNEWCATDMTPQPFSALLRAELDPKSGSFVKKHGMMDLRQIIWYVSKEYTVDERAVQITANSESSGWGVPPLTYLQMYEHLHAVNEFPDKDWDDRRVRLLQLTHASVGHSTIRYLSNLEVLILLSGRANLASFGPGPTLSYPEPWIRSTLQNAVTRDLRVLKLPAGVNVDSELGAIVVGFTKLQALSLWDTKLDSGSLSWIKELSQLRVVDLDGTAASDEDLASLGAIKTLQAVSLNGTQVTDAGLQHLANCPDLFEIRAVNTKVTEAGVRRLKAAAPALRFVELKGNRPIDMDHVPE